MATLDKYFRIFTVSVPARSVHMQIPHVLSINYELCSGFKNAIKRAVGSFDGEREEGQANNICSIVHGPFSC